MPGRKAGESLFQFGMRVCWETGQFWGLPDAANITQDQVALLQPTDDIAVRALISLAKMDSTQYTIKSLNAGHVPDFSGSFSPAMQEMVQAERCPVPDHAPPPGVVFAFDDQDMQQLVTRMQRRAVLPATGSGNWSQCHGVGNFHCASVRVDQSGLPAFLSPVFLQVLRNVQVAYAGVGLLWRFIGTTGLDLLTGEAFTGNINTDMSFVPRSDGWIGLAIVGQKEDCGSKIWCKFLSTYRGGSDNAAIVTQWTSLLKHELGHNCGRLHTNGGVMNPSIVNGLPVEWGPNDPSTGWLKGQFGGVPVPIPGSQPPGPGPGPSPDPPSSVVDRLKALELQNLIHEVAVGYQAKQIKDLQTRVKALEGLG